MISDAGADTDERVAPAFDFVVEPGKAAEFARAASTPLPSGDDPRAPVTFLAASALWMVPENSAWHGIARDYRRVLHGEQRFDYPRGLPAIGTRFRARQRFGRRFEKPGSRGLMQFTEVVTSFWTDSESDPDATMTSLSITLPDTAPTAEAPAGAQPVSAASIGSVAHRTAEPLTITDFVRYQGASGDFNPIHHDTAFAVSAGFPGPFAVGMLTAAVGAGEIGRVRDLNRLRSFRARWKAQAWPGDRLTYAIEPVTADDVELTVTRDTGGVHMLAWADFA